MTFEDLLSCIHENNYIKNSCSNNKKDFNSLSYIVDRNLSHSDCCKLGVGIEKVLLDFILKSSSLKSIKEKNQIGKKEKDHLFCDENEKVIYYAELKSNLNLDTEKSRSTYKKCLSIVEELQTQYPEYTIKWCLLGCRYVNSHEIPTFIQKKYTEVHDNLFGINQYLNMLNIQIELTEVSHKFIINEVANKMFEPK